MLQDISTQAKYHWRAEESLASNMGWSATELHQQDHTELCKKTSSLCELGADTLNTSWNKLFAGFWTVSKLWQSEISHFHVFVWFQYKHYSSKVQPVPKAAYRSGRRDKQPSVVRFEPGSSNTAVGLTCKLIMREKLRTSWNFKIIVIQ